MCTLTKNVYSHKECVLSQRMCTLTKNVYFHKEYVLITKNAYSHKGCVRTQRMCTLTKLMCTLTKNVYSHKGCVLSQRMFTITKLIRTLTKNVYSHKGWDFIKKWISIILKKIREISPKFSSSEKHVFKFYVLTNKSLVWLNFTQTQLLDMINDQVWGWKKTTFNLLSCLFTVC